MSAEARLAALAHRWSRAEARERANAQSYLIELAEALGVSKPGPAGSGYEFELPIQVVNTDGTETTKFADLYKRGCFVLEAKDEEEGRATDVLLRKAYGQARGYVSHVPGELPPYLLVLDVAKTLIIWDRWSGSYGGYNAGRRIDLRTLAENPEAIALLQDIWESPQARNAAARSETVTREIATKLAKLAASLEERGYDQERVARFLMRCVFTMFAEDVGLLEDEPFRKAVTDIGFDDPADLQAALEELWRAMDAGTHFGYRKLMRFNGHFFKDPEALLLAPDDVVVLHEAAQADWADVEPTIFGTLLVRALNPQERHRLGAEYTPRDYVERLVRPTIEEPVRERWVAVQSDVLQLREAGKEKQALKRLDTFHGWLRSLRILDPACGSGNFLYVALATLKQVELEVFRLIEEITGQHESAVEEVNPGQFFGIEVKLWAREIAELTLWIGYHQWWVRTHGNVRPPEPVLQETETIEHRDAVLAWDNIVEDPERSRPDPTPRIAHGVTGALVPDPTSTLAYEEHVRPRMAQWPEADFIIGNPPYLGRGRQREAFGDGYVEALRETYQDVPDNADYVMYWWYRAAREIAAGRTIRAGLITTNTIRQVHNREVVANALENGVRLVWTVPDHPWLDEGGAAVRVSLTTFAGPSETRLATLVRVSEDGAVESQQLVSQINPDLTAHANVARAAQRPLLANTGICSQGFILVGSGFVLDAEEGTRVREGNPGSAHLVKRYLTGRDLTGRPREQYVIDFGLLDEAEAKGHPVLYDLIRDRVKPDRSANARRAYRELWWRFGEPRSSFRPALENLDRFIATVETSRHRFFTFLDQQTIPSHTIVCVALDDPYWLGVLSSSIHVQWALATGGRLGVGNDPRYQKAMTFDPFPFPDAAEEERLRVSELALGIEAHRTEATARHNQVTYTGMYNVVEKLRSRAPLSQAERNIHEVAACGTLRDLHDQLDVAVAASYGWEWPLSPDDILQRLVDLHAQRVAEEEAGMVRWLRPDYQRVRFAPEQEVIPGTEVVVEPEEEPREIVDWPGDVLEQISALRVAVAERAGDIETIASTFRGARRKLVARHLETLEILGEVRRDTQGRYHPVAEPLAGIAA